MTAQVERVCCLLREGASFAGIIDRGLWVSFLCIGSLRRH